MGALNRSFTRSHVHVLLFFLFMLTVIWAPTASADSVSWAGIAPNWTALPNPFTTTSAEGITVTGSMPPGESVLATLECLDPSTITPCIDENFLSGDPLLATEYKTGPSLTFSFSSPLQSINTQIQTAWYGPFSATLTAFGSGGGVLGTTTVNGSTGRTHDGSAPFLSFTSGAGIYSVSITAASQSPLSDYDGFAINQLNVAPLAIAVSIDIKPGSFPNYINPKSKGPISVAILSTATFDARKVDPLTVRFGPSGATVISKIGLPQDVNGDGIDDLVLYFNLQQTGIKCGDTSASLTGTTFCGENIQGSDSINRTNCK